MGCTKLELTKGTSSPPAPTNALDAGLALSGTSTVAVRRRARQARAS